MASSINGGRIDKAFARELSQVQEDFEAMETAEKAAFNSADFPSQNANIMIKQNEEAFNELKAGRIDAEIINAAHGEAAPQQEAGRTLDDVLESAPEIEAKNLTGPNTDAKQSPSGPTAGKP